VWLRLGSRALRAMFGGHQPQAVDVAKALDSGFNQVVRHVGPLLQGRTTADGGRNCTAACSKVQAACAC